MLREPEKTHEVLRLQYWCTIYLTHDIQKKNRTNKIQSAMMLNMKHGYKTGEIAKENKTIKKLKILDKVQEFIGNEQKQIEP
jgi:hypothetical protein